MENPQAFPMAAGNPSDGGDWVKGMTLRDYFAGQALIAIAQKDSCYLYITASCGIAYNLADAMLEERIKNG